MWGYRYFPLFYHLFPQNLPLFSANRNVHISARLYRIQFRCSRSHDYTGSCAFFFGLQIFWNVMHVTATAMPTIQYQFKWRLFSRRPCTCPYPWAGPQSRLQRLDLIIQLSSNSFNLCFTHLPRCQRVLRRRALRSDLMSRKGCSVPIANGCPSAPVKIKQVRPP